MSMKRPWYKRYPDHFIAATVHMTFEQKAAYSLIIDLIHASDGRLKDDDRRISRVLGVRIHYWKRLKKELETLGKVRVNSGESQTYIEFVGTFSGLSPSQPIENIRSTANKPIRRIEKNKIQKESLRLSLSESKSAGARASLGDKDAAPLDPAPQTAVVLPSPKLEPARPPEERIHQYVQEWKDEAARQRQILIDPLKASLKRLPSHNAVNASQLSADELAAKEAEALAFIEAMVVKTA
jgi:hypothetical protein